MFILEGYVKAVQCYLHLELRNVGPKIALSYLIARVGQCVENGSCMYMYMLSHWLVIHDFMVCRYRYINVHVYLQMGILITTLYPPC